METPKNRLPQSLSSHPCEMWKNLSVCLSVCPGAQHSPGGLSSAGAEILVAPQLPCHPLVTSDKQKGCSASSGTCQKLSGSPGAMELSPGAGLSPQLPHGWQMVTADSSEQFLGWWQHSPYGRAITVPAPRLCAPVKGSWRTTGTMTVISRP